MEPRTDTNRNVVVRDRNRTGWIVAAVVALAVMGGIFYIMSDNTNTATNINTSPGVTTGSSTGAVPPANAPIAPK